MRRTLGILLLLISGLYSQTSDFTATWAGKLAVQGQQLRLLFHIQLNEEGNYTGSVDSPDQGAGGIPISAIKVEGNKIYLTVRSIRGSFEGTMAAHGQTIEGIWRQGGMQIPIILDRKPLQVEQLLKNDKKKELASKLFGAWKGNLKLKNNKDLPIIFHLKASEKKTIEGSFDSPSQNAFGVPISQISGRGSRVNIFAGLINARFFGNLSKDGKTLKGIWQQGETQMPLTLQQAKEETVLKRPQTPKPPFPYEQQEVQFESKSAGGVLKGTLLSPKEKGKYPAVVLVSGSGPQDRDESIFGHKPFLVLADYLVRKGIVVLRYDDRGTGASSGVFAKATTADFAEDASAALQFLRGQPKVDAKKAGILGHSEGGIVAVKLAAGENAPAFIVLLSAPAIPGDELMLLQNEAILQANKIDEEVITAGLRLSAQSYAIIKTESDPVKAAQKIRYLEDNFWGSMFPNIREGLKKTGMQKGFLVKQLPQLLSPWMRYFISYDPATDLKKIKCPVLAIYGEKDLQVPPKRNADKMKELLSGSGQLLNQVRIVPQVNHLMQECETGLPGEYAKIEQTFAPKVLNMIDRWIKAAVVTF